jgi:hypothetical protein
MNPNLGELAAHLLGSTRAVPFKKGGVFRVTIQGLTSRRSRRAGLGSSAESVAAPASLAALARSPIAIIINPISGTAGESMSLANRAAYAAGVFLGGRRISIRPWSSSPSVLVMHANLRWPPSHADRRRWWLGVATAP